MFAILKYSGTFPLPYTACVAHVLSETNLISLLCLAQTVKRAFLLACRRTAVPALRYRPRDGTKIYIFLSRNESLFINFLGDQ